MATRAEVLNAYATTPGATTTPDQAAINYWMNAGLGGFQQAVTNYNKTTDAATVANAGGQPTTDSVAAAGRIVSGIAAGTLPWNTAALDLYSSASGGQARPIDPQVEGSPIYYSIPNPNGKDLAMLNVVQGTGGMADPNYTKAWTAQTNTQAAIGAITPIAALAAIAFGLNGLDSLITGLTGLTTAETAPAFLPINTEILTTTAGVTPAVANSVATAAASGLTTAELAPVIQQLVVTGAAGGTGAGLTAAQIAAAAAATAAGAGLLSGGGGTTTATTAPTTPTTATTVPTTETIPSISVTGAAPTAAGPLTLGTVGALTAANLLLGTNTATNIPQVEVTATKPVTPTTTNAGGLTTAQLTALGLAGAGALSLNNTGPTGQSTDTVTGGAGNDILSLLTSLAPGLLNSYLASKGAGSYQGIYDTAANSLTSTAAANQKGYQFNPIGMTTAFGNATPKFDSAGKLIGYDYAATPAVAAQRDQLMKLSQQALPTTTDPTAVMNNYISQQQGLLAPGQAQDLATLQAQMAATGRSGLGTGATAGTAFSPALAATNPQLAAYYNSLAQQNQQITANAPTYAQNLLNSQIGTSGTLFGQAQGLETAAQQPVQMGTQLGGLITGGTTNAANAAYTSAADAAKLTATGALGAMGQQQLAQSQLLSAASPAITNAAGKVFDWATGLFK